MSNGRTWPNTETDTMDFENAHHWTALHMGDAVRKAIDAINAAENPTAQEQAKI